MKNSAKNFCVVLRWASQRSIHAKMARTRSRRLNGGENEQGDGLRQRKSDGRAAVMPARKPREHRLPRMVAGSARPKTM